MTNKTEPETNRSAWSGPSRLRSAQGAVTALLLFGCALITIVTTFLILGVLGGETISFFRVSKIGMIEFFSGTEIDFKSARPRFGLPPLIWGTFVIAVGASLVALPIGLLSAIFLSEYAPERLRRVLKPTLELLAGIPTIVYGYLALTVITPWLQSVLAPLGIRVEQFNAFSGCVVVGIMIVPLVSSLSEDVLSAAPRSLREAGYALGATKFEVATRIVLPASYSGVAASFILAISRAIGETMAVVLAAGSLAQIKLNPFTSIETMTAYIVAVTNGEASYGSPEYLSLFAVGMTLFFMTLCLNMLSGAVIRRYREATP